MISWLEPVSYKECLYHLKPHIYMSKKFGGNNSCLYSSYIWEQNMEISIRVCTILISKNTLHDLFAHPLHLLTREYCCKITLLMKPSQAFLLLMNIFKDFDFPSFKKVISLLFWRPIGQDFLAYMISSFVKILFSLWHIHFSNINFIYI